VRELGKERAQRRSGLRILGAGSGLASQYVVARINHVDVPTLKAKIGAGGAFAGLALDLADEAPKALLDIAIPIATKQLREYGIDATITAANAVPEARGSSEFWLGLVVGGAVGGGALLIWRWILRPLFGALK
jgi:hypothetical protein